MKPSQEELLEIAKTELASDIASLRFEGTTVTGKHGLVSANLKTREVFVHRAPGGRPFYTVKAPVDGNGLTKALTHPALRGWGSLDGMDDPIGVLFAFINIVDLKAPVDLRSIKLSPEAAKYLGFRNLSTTERVLK